LFPTNTYAKKATTLAELRAELASLKKQKADNQKQQNLTKNEINSAKNNITKKETQIEINQQKVIDATNESAKLEEEIASGKETLEKLVQSYQVAKGDNVYLEYIFQAKSYEDLVYRYAIMEQLMDYQENLISSWKEKIEYNSQLKIDLANKEKELNNQIDSLASDIKKLGTKLDELDDMIPDINAEIASVQSSINYYTQLGCKENEDLNACMAVASSKIFRRPLVKGTITSAFGYRTHPITGKKSSFHSGTDIGVKEGTNVYPIANGTVSKITRKSNCGGNMVYIQHIVNGKKYTSTYMHLLEIKVKIGKTVTTEDVIALSGGSSTKSYDHCTTGGHLHLSLATGWYEKDYFGYSNWRSHLINPKTTLNLPSSWSTR
ncbi:MAG: peptidoglycan DD-metalloendopeptidase family protein, partial [Bacilli bacterium]|nr:peptidoglycan DD-metalloendopeptidase family protein [Bacilli bacterium]